MTGNVEPHLRYGQLQGWFIDLPNGHKCYLKDSTKRKIIRQHYAWAIETAVLKQAKARGVTYAGVRVPYKDGKSQTWMTPIEDFFNPVKSVYWHAAGGCRALGLDQFQINPTAQIGVIKRLARIR